MFLIIAVYHAGASYSSLQAIAEIKPEFVKIDMSLIRNIDKNPTKKALTFKVKALIFTHGRSDWI